MIIADYTCRKDRYLYLHYKKTVLFFSFFGQNYAFFSIFAFILVNYIWN